MTSFFAFSGASFFRVIKVLVTCDLPAFNEKTIFLSVFFTVFLRLQIYEAIAAIFWHSASCFAIFCVADFSSDAFNFSSSKTR